MSGRGFAGLDLNSHNPAVTLGVGGRLEGVPLSV